MTPRILLVVVATLLLCWQCSAEVTLLHDDFDGAALDPAWNVRFDLDPPASGWEYEVASGSLTVTDIDGHELEAWSSVHLRRECRAPGDFSLSCGFSWDSINGNPGAMQNLRVALVDTSGGDAARVMYYDCWAGEHGAMYATVGSAQFLDTDHLPWIGSATVRVERHDSTVSVYWDDDEILTGIEASAIDSLDLSFWYFYRYSSFFGTESVDYVTVTAPETAVQSSSWSRIKAMFGR